LISNQDQASTRLIYINKSYTIRIKSHQNIGESKEKICIWLDSSPSIIVAASRKQIFEEEYIMFDLLNRGVKEFIVRFKMKPIQKNQHEINEFMPRSLPFKCTVLQLFLTIHNALILSNDKKIGEVEAEIK
jgi:hypothetical protein